MCYVHKSIHTNMLKNSINKKQEIKSVIMFIYIQEFFLKIFSKKALGACIFLLLFIWLRLLLD